MRRVFRIIDETAVLISMLAGIYFGVSFIIISLFSHLQKL